MVVTINKNLQTVVEYRKKYYKMRKNFVIIIRMF